MSRSAISFAAEGLFPFAYLTCCPGRFGQYVSLILCRQGKLLFFHVIPTGTFIASVQYELGTAPAHQPQSQIRNPCRLLGKGDRR